MKNKLDEIILNKRMEIIQKQKYRPNFKKEDLFINNPKKLLSQNLKSEGINIIAEYKRKSPSGLILEDEIALEDCVRSYVSNGAAGISILTDHRYFGGTEEDLKITASISSSPILRKDFIIDEYQIFESKAFGADVILLIASILSPQEVKQFSKLAKSLSMEVILEIRNEKELNDKFTDDIDIIGVNNRNLDTLETSIDISLQLTDNIPVDTIKISESGIENSEQISELRAAGYDGFLIGHSFLRKADPGNALKQLMQNPKEVLS